MQGSKATTRHEVNTWHGGMESIYGVNNAWRYGSVQVNNSLDIDSWHPEGDTHLNNPSAESTRLKYV